MKNTKRFSVLAALAMGLVIAAGAFVAPAMSYANEEHKEDHKGDHEEGRGEHDEHGHDKH